MKNSVIASKIYRSTKVNGGATVDLKGRTPTSGYMYAPSKDTETIIESKNFNPQVISSFMNKNWRLLQEEGNHIGAWENEGNVFLDISKVGRPTPETIEEARKCHQLAVYDLAQGKEIFIGSND
jgi:hypothetical protein